MRVLVIIFVVAAMLGCSDKVVTRFSNIQEAQQEGAFERGWLPPILPISVYQRSSVVELILFGSALQTDSPSA